MSLCSSLTVVTSTTVSNRARQSQRVVKQNRGDLPRAESFTMMTSGALRPMEASASVVEYKNMKFLITERPLEKTMPVYVKEMKRHNVTCVVRVGGTEYSTEKLVDNGISVVDLPYEDGTAPSGEIISTWCQLLRSSRSIDQSVSVAIHCVAGLGRAPVLVAIALIELGMKYEDAVDFIRQRRRGAINAKQLDFLSRYKPKSRLSVKNKSCLIM